MAAGVSFAPEDFAYTFRTGMCPLRRRRAFFAEGRGDAGYAMRPQIATGLREIPKGAILPKTSVVGVFAFNVSEVCHRVSLDGAGNKNVSLKSAWGFIIGRFEAPFRCAGGNNSLVAVQRGICELSIPDNFRFQDNCKVLAISSKNYAFLFSGVGKFQVNNYLCLSIRFFFKPRDTGKVYLKKPQKQY